MTREFTEGAEAGDVAFFTTTSGVSISTSGRINGRAFSLGNTATWSKSVAGSAEYFFRFAINISGVSGAFIIRWLNGATELGSIRRNVSTTAFDLYTGTATLVASGVEPVPSAAWSLIELRVKIDDSAGVIQIKVNGITDATFNGDTKPGAATTITVFNCTNPNFTTTLLDDFALNTTAGAVDNSWCGDAHIYPLTPNGNGDSSQFTGSDGNSTDNYLLVDEIPSNGDTDYVQSLTSGHVDLYNLTDLPALPTGSSINRVIVEVRARELTADGDSIQLAVKTNGVQGLSSSIVLGTSFAAKKHEFLVSPDTGVAWLQSEITNLQAGYKVP